MIKGIDLSNNNSYNDARNEINNDETSFVWLKATEGRTYKDACFDEYVQMVRSRGKILGAYHFARPDNNTPYSEAEWFAENVKEYLNDGIMLALDWEQGLENASPDWIAQFMGHVQYLLKLQYPPVIYISQSNYQKWKWNIPFACGLWIASWDVSTKYVIDSIDRLVAFHQTGIDDGIDRDVFNGDIEQCKKYLCYSRKNESDESTFEVRIERLLTEILEELRRMK